MKKSSTWYNLLFLLFLLPLTDTYEQQDDGWEFKKNKNDIKIYTRDIEGYKLKELKFVTTINSTMNQAIALLIDIPSYSNWVYSCDQAITLKEITNLESYCYYKIDFPWPMSDRDLVAYSKIIQDPETKIVTSDTNGAADYIPTEKGYIRLQRHFNQWNFKPLSAEKIEITYFLKSDPGGNIPVWAINLALDQGPVKSMKGFKKQLNDEIYKNANVPGIEDF